jgi:hypothetical protein
VARPLWCCNQQAYRPPDRAALMRHLIKAHAIIPMRPPQRENVVWPHLPYRKNPRMSILQRAKELYQKHDEDVRRERQRALDQMRANEGYVCPTEEKEERYGNTDS